MPGVQGCTRGGYGWVGTREGYTGTPPDCSQDPKFSIFKAKGHTHGQMKVNMVNSMRFLRYGPQIDPQMTHIDPRIDPPRHPPGLVPRRPPDPHIQDLRYQGLRIGLI